MVRMSTRYLEMVVVKKIELQEKNSEERERGLFSGVSKMSKPQVTVRAGFGSRPLNSG